MELVQAKYILTMAGEPLTDSALAFEMGKIREIGPVEHLVQKYPQAAIHSYPQHAILPGLANTHLHLDLAGVADYSMSLRHGNQPEYIDWLLHILRNRSQLPMAQTISNTQTALKHLIDSGTTTIGTMCAFEGAIKIIDEMGMRAVFYPEIYTGAGAEGQDRFESALAQVEKYLDATLDRIKVGLGPFAPYLLSRNLLKIISRHATNLGVPVQIHAAESFAEMEFFYNSSGDIATNLFPALGWVDTLPPCHQKTPIQFLEEIGFLESSPTIVGGLHLGIRDFNILARNMCRVVYCPKTNHYLGHGNFPLGKLQEVGVPIGVGTDTLAGEEGLNLWNELRFIQDTSITPTPTPKELMQMATLGGARALGLDCVTGSLVPNKQADFIVVDLPQHTDLPLIYDTLIRHTRPHHITRVVVAGENLKN